MTEAHTHIRRFEEIGSDDVDLVGGKNASLGEMIRNLRDRGIRVPGGFAVTAEGYRLFLEANDLEDAIAAELEKLRGEKRSLRAAGRAIRKAIRKAEFPEELSDEIRTAYDELCKRHETQDVAVAVRSSATAEDLPEASFAGQQETFLNVSGADDLLDACRGCFASLFTDRAIAYREEKGFDHTKVALSVGVQKMVRSDQGGAGVMFTIDTETGFPDFVVIDAAWGLGETVVQGSVTPDEYRVFKPLLRSSGKSPIVDKVVGSKEQKMVYADGGDDRTRTARTSREERRGFVLDDDRILTLARWAVRIEEHYGKPMDIEWALDGETGDLFIVQARPETVQSRKTAASLKSYELHETGKVLVEGLAIGSAIAAGRVRVLEDVGEADDFEEGDILVTDRTDPDWVPVMKRAAGIVTDQGGRTSHAAIVSRELGVAAIIGTGDATSRLEDGQEVTLDCTEGTHGRLYEGILEHTATEIDLDDVPETSTRVLMNIASPDAALRWWRLPVQGVGLARMEFLIDNVIGIHPMALVHFDEIEDREAKREIERRTRGYEDRTEYFVDHLARGIARVAATRYPDPVLVRLSDFKANEYAELIGGSRFEPEEANPMLGFRGAARYYSERYREGFALECRALVRVRDEIGLENVHLMIPFCRTLEEADRVLGVLAEHGLTRGKDGLEVYVMCEIPSNVVLADRFAERFDGFSIGTNDLTQLVLGVDRDAEELAYLYDERSEAVRRMIRDVVRAAHEAGRKVGICGQAPSDHPEFADFLVQVGIDSISLNPDSVLEAARRIARAEESRARKHGED
jgi:pyruvate,water dikinase